MLPDRVSNPGPLTYESGALPIAAPAREAVSMSLLILLKCKKHSIAFVDSKFSIWS